MLFAIGAGPQVVAVSSFDEYPPEVKKLQRVGRAARSGSRADPLAAAGSRRRLRQPGRPAARSSTRASIPIYIYRHAGLADVIATIARGRRARRARAEAAALVATDRRAARPRSGARIAGRPRPRTLLVFGRESGALRGIYASGGIGFLHDMLEAAGGDERLRRREARVGAGDDRADPRAAARRDPRVRAGPPDRQLAIARAVTSGRTLSSVPAVRNGRVQFVVDPRTVVPGPRVAEATELLARALHPEVFK